MVRDEEIRQTKARAGKEGMKNRYNKTVITPVITKVLTPPESENENKNRLDSISLIVINSERKKIFDKYFKSNFSTVLNIGLVSSLKEIMTDEQKKEYTAAIKEKFLKQDLKEIKEAINKPDETCKKLMNEFICEIIGGKKQYIGLNELAGYFIKWVKHYNK